MKLRLREYSPAGVMGRVLPHAENSLSWTVVENGSPLLKFALSDTVLNRMPDDGFAVGVWYSLDGIKWLPAPYHDRFIVLGYSGDDADSSKTLTFVGESLPLWWLKNTYVHWHVTAVNKVRKVSGNAAHHFNLFFTESKARGWGTHLTFPYVAGKDSAGVSWLGSDSVELEWREGDTLFHVLTRLSELGLCDWDVVGGEFRLYRPGTRGTDKTNLVLSSAGMHRAPVKMDASGMITNMSVMSDTGYWQYLSNPAGKWGRLEATMSMSGVGDPVVAEKLARPVLDAAKKALREEAFEYDPREVSLAPFKDFHVGDTLKVDVRGGRSDRRVIGLILQEDTVQVRVGEAIGTRDKRVLQKLAATTGGGLIGGTGNAFPVSPGPALLAPAQPSGLVESSNVGVWLADGSALSTVGLSWAAVTASEDGSEATISHYEILSRLPHESLSFVTTTHDTTVAVDSWTPLVPRMVAVVAVATNGKRSVPSLEIEVIPVMPVSVVPKQVTGLTVASNVGSFTPAGPVAAVKLDWAAVTESTDDEPLTVAEYIVLMDGFEHTRTSGLTVTVTVPSDAVRGIRVIAVTGQGVQGDPSALVEVTGEKPVLVSRVPSTPTFKTGFGSLIAVWDGVYTSGGTAGAHSVRVEARVGTSGAFIVQGTLTGAGEQLISLGDVDDTVQVRFIAVDALGRDTGTSATASEVRAPIPIDVIDPELAEQLGDLAGGQSVILKTMDGLNHVFVQQDEPGTGYIGYENLAPPIVGSGVWAETQRNYAVDPLALGANNSGNATNVVDFPDEVNTAWEHIKSGATALRMVDVLTGSSVPTTGVIRFQCLVWLSVARTLEIALRDTIVGGGSGYTVNRALPAGLSVLEVDFPGAWETPSSTAGVTLIARSGWQTGDVFRATKFQIQAGHDEQPFVSGGYPSPDTDMRTRFVGAANSSQTVLEIETVAGYGSARAIAGLSQVDGKLAIRPIPTDPSNTLPTAITQTIPVAARGGGTFVATLHNPGVTIGLHAPRLHTTAPVSTTNYPTAPGTHDGRHVYGALTSNYGAYLYGGSGVKGSGDIRWTGIGLYAGVLPEDAQKLKPGDFWWRLNSLGQMVEVRVYDGQEWNPHRIVAQDVIALGSIVGALIQAGTLQVDHLAPNVGDDLTLTARGQIQMLVENVDELASDLADVSSVADSAAAAASTASGQAAAAASAAAIADGKALVADTKAQAGLDGLAAQQAVFVVTANGAEVRSKDASNIVQIAPTGVAIIQGGDPVSTWDGARFISNEIRTNRMQLSNNHVIESSGTRTVIRQL